MSTRGTNLSQLQNMAAAGFDPILNMGNCWIKRCDIDKESVDGYSEPMTPILRRLVWD
jgi:hypothetical protein